MLVEFLDGSMMIRDEAGKRKVTRREALILSLAKRALGGNVRAQQLLLQHAIDLEPDVESKDTGAISESDRDLLEGFRASAVREALAEMEAEDDCELDDGEEFDDDEEYEE